MLNINLNKNERLNKERKKKQSSYIDLTHATPSSHRSNDIARPGLGSR